MKFRLIALFALAMPLMALNSCDGKKENRKLKEAAAIHEEMMHRYDSTYHALVDKRKEIDQRMQSLNEVQQSANESMLRSIQKSISLLQGWQESVVGVPGYNFGQSEHHHHDHGDGHDHGDHDHSHGNTGYANDKILVGMSDQEVLDLQRALRTRLNEVVTEINNLLDTIKMYEDSER